MAEEDVKVVEGTEETVLETTAPEATDAVETTEVVEAPEEAEKKAEVAQPEVAA